MASLRWAQASLRWARGLLGLAAVGVGCSVLQMGCASNESAFFIEAIGSDSTGKCECPAGESGRFLAGAFDPSFGSSYSTCVALQSNLSSGKKAENYNRTETNQILIYAYDLVVTSSSGSFATTIATGGALIPGGSYSMLVPLIPREAVDTLGLGSADEDVVVTVTVYGRTTGGVEVETPEMSYGVTVFGSPVCSCTAVTETCHPGADLQFPTCPEGTPGCPETPGP
jgi:hypothetical protein